MILVPCRHREVIAQGWVLTLGRHGRDQQVGKSIKELNVEWSGMTSLQVWLPRRTRSWDEWDGSSNGSRENWVYVSRRGEGNTWGNSDPWRRWYGSSDDSWHGRDGRGQHSGEVSRQQQGHDHEQGRHSGESEGEGGRRDGLPTGKVESVHDKADKEEEKKAQGKVSSSSPPVFKAKQGENYREWKRSVKFWLRGEGQNLPTSLIGPRVMVQLRERAAQLVKHLEPEDVDGKGGLDLIFQVLEKSPLIRQSEKHRVDWHRKRLLNLSRMAGESLESYITRASLYRDQLAGLDASLSMGERFFVGHLLDHAKLTRRDKAMLKTHAGDETEGGITSAMMELSGELEGEAGFPIGQAEGQLSGAQGEEFMVQRGVMGFRFPRKEKAALAAEVNDMETATQMSFAMEPVPEEQGEEGVDEADAAMPADVLHAEHEALALQYKARQKMAEVKKLRNFYRKGEEGKKNKLVKCFVCDEPGHIARDCPKVKGTLNTSNQVLVTSSSNTSKTDAEAAEWDLLASLCCVTEESPNKDRAVYMVQRGSWMGEVDDGQSFNTGVVPHEAWWNMQELAKKVILDLGCMRNVVGVKWATDVIEAWKSNQRWFKIIPEAEVFRFGDGNTLRSRYRLQLEATFGGRRVLLAFSVVPGPCPPLLSKQSHTKLGVKLDTEHHTMSSRKLKVQNYGLVETDAGHYTMRIDEFHLLPPEDETWKEAGKTVMLSDDEVALFEPAQPDAEVFGSVVDQVNSVPLDEVQLPSSSQSAAMPPVRISGASDKELSQHRGGKCRGAVRDLGDTEHAGRGREAASQGGAEEHGTGCGSCGDFANSEVHQAAESNSSCKGSQEAWVEVPQEEFMDAALPGLAPEEAALILKRRAKQAVSKNKKAQSAALTGGEADYPSLSNCWSNELTFNILRSTESRLRTFQWKKMVWQLRVREAVKMESKGKATWRRNPRWLTYLLSYEIAALWGHYKPMKQRLRSTDFLNQLQKRH